MKNKTIAKSEKKTILKSYIHTRTHGHIRVYGEITVETKTEIDKATRTRIQYIYIYMRAYFIHKHQYAHA